MMSEVVHDCDDEDDLHSSLHSILCKNTKNTTSQSMEDETLQTKHEILLLKRLIQMQKDKMDEYEKNIESLSRNSPRSSAGSFDSEYYLEMEKKIEELRDENKRLVLECRKNSVMTERESEQIFIPRDVYEDLIIERKHLKSQYDAYKELFESSEAHVFNLEDQFETLKVENKQLMNEINKLNYSHEKLKEEYRSSRIEFDDLISRLTKKNEEKEVEFRNKMMVLTKEKKQALLEVDNLNCIVENLLKTTKEKYKNDTHHLKHVEALNKMSKLIEELEEKFFLLTKTLEEKDITPCCEKQMINSKELVEINLLDDYKKQIIPCTEIKSLQDEIEEIQVKEINVNYNKLSYSQESQLFESFIYLAICLLVYEFYIFIMYIF
uniref:Coiled-coil domain-containing protein n=1 Tax=Parastrongyloides trichosuri TaxID=131310 RepID=A0A0N4Z4T5_PARTI